MVYPIETFSLKCSKCGKQLDFDEKDAGFVCQFSEERGMDIGRAYVWESSFLCECGQVIEFIYEVWEYPEGAFQTDEIKFKGATELSRYTYDFYGNQEIEIV